MTSTGHCVGGDGAHNIGQRASDVAGYDAQHNILQALIEWVEDGRAPDTITGTRYIDSVSRSRPKQDCNADMCLKNNHALGVDYERRHCRYPYRNFCHDTLNYKNPDSWSCIV